MSVNKSTFEPRFILKILTVSFSLLSKVSILFFFCFVLEELIRCFNYTTINKKYTVLQCESYLLQSYNIMYTHGCTCVHDIMQTTMMIIIYGPINYNSAYPTCGYTRYLPVTLLYG